MSPADEKGLPWWRSRGFWPQVGTTLVLLGSWVGGEIDWKILLAACLTSWGSFIATSSYRGHQLRKPRPTRRGC